MVARLPVTIVSTAEADQERRPMSGAPRVLLRNSKLGTPSDRGGRNVERMQTVATTLKRAGRSVSEYVIEVSRSVLRGASAPALLQ